MEAKDRKKVNQSGHEGHGVHVCHKCGWPFPNPHPSAKHRRAHKRICGSIEGYKLVGVSEEEKTTHLNGSGDEHLFDDDRRTPSSKGVERTVSGSSGGVGSRSSRSTRSEDEVFADAVTDFGDGAGGVEDCSAGVREQANVMQNIAEDNSGLTQLPGENAVAVAGNLHPQCSSSGSQLWTTHYSRAEHERVEEEKPSHEILSSSTIDPVRTDPDAGDAKRRASKNLLQASSVSVALDSDEKGSKEQVICKTSVELATIVAENSGKMIDAVYSPGMVTRASLDSALTGPMLEVKGKPEVGLDTKNVCSPKVDSIRVIDTVDDSSQAKHNANEEAGSSIGMIEEGLGSSTDHVLELNVPDDLPLKEHPEIMLEDFKDLHKEGRLAISPSLDPSPEVEIMEHEKDFVSKETESTTAANYPDGSTKLKSEDAISQAIDSMEAKVKLVVMDVKSTEEAAVKDTVTDTIDSEIYGSRSVTVHEDLDCDENRQFQKDESSEEQKPLPSCDKAVQEDNAIRIVKDIEAVHDDDKDSQFHDVLENEGFEGDKEKSLVTGDMYCEVTDHVASEVGETTDLIGGSDGGISDTKSRVQKEELSEFEVGFHGKVEAEKNYRHDDVGTDLDSTGTHMSKTVESDFQLKNSQELQGVKDLGSSLDQTVGGEGNGSSLGYNLDASLKVGIVDRCHEQKVSDSAAVSRLSNVNESEALLGKSDASPERAKEQNNPGKNVFGGECVGKVELGLMSDHDDGIDPSKKTAKEVTLPQQGDSISSVQSSAAVENKITREMGKEASIVDKCDTNQVKHDEFVSALDSRADSSIQTDSLGGNGVSVSVLSASSDAPPATEIGSLPSQEWVQAEKPSLQSNTEVKGSYDKSDVSELTLVDEEEANDQKEAANNVELLQKPQEEVKDSPGRKRNEEIIAKVTNWSSGKQHMPLKSLLGEPDLMDDIPPTASIDDLAKTEKAILDTQKKPVGEAAKEQVGKEWNSPARYPANIKREKGKVRTYWVPFICCSSIETN